MHRVSSMNLVNNDEKRKKARKENNKNKAFFFGALHMDLLPRVLASPVAGEHACYVNVYLKFKDLHGHERFGDLGE
jgi:hypothetical protein